MKNKAKIRNIYFYQSPNLTDDEIKKHFVVRQNEFQRIISEIKRDDMNGSIQHFLLIGRRGSGKSTLLRRIQAEINTDKNLNNKLIVINLSEEQAGVYRLFDLWDLVIRELKTRNYITEETDWMDFKDDPTEYSKSLYLNIRTVLKNADKKLILLVDNIDRIFDNIGDDAHLLRELLMNYNDLRIIGGSTRLSEHYWKYGKAFYQFFRIIRLDSLTADEVRELLIYWSEFLELPEIRQFIEKHPGQIDTIRVLTDGMPRTLLNFIEILIDRPEQNGFEYLRLIIDRATPLYQERLSKLPSAQRKIVLELSFFWDAVKLRPLIENCKMTGKIISAQLNKLVYSGIVEKIKGQQKDNLYRLSERFFNLWLLMTQGGPKEKHEVKYLTIFLENWYDRDELLQIFSKHLGDLDTKDMKKDYAVLMSKALAHSKYITLTQRDKLIEKTQTIKDIKQEHLDFLPEPSDKIYKHAYSKITEGKYKEARKILDRIEQEDTEKYSLIGFSYIKEKKYTDAEVFLLKAIEKGHVGAMYNLALLYKNTNRQEESEKYYLKAIEKGNVGAMNNLAVLYKDMNRQEEAEKYYLKAIEKGHVGAMYNLALLYQNTNRQEEAEKYYLKAIDKGIVEAIYNLALLYEDTNRQEEAEKYYLKAIKKGDVGAMYNLALLYQNKNRQEEAEKYYLKAIKKGHVKAMYNLAFLYYLENKNPEKAINLIEKFLKNQEDLKSTSLYSIILLWAGKMEEFEQIIKKLIPELVKEKQIDLLELLIIDLLVHQQYLLVWEWFTNEKYREILKELIRPLYYVAAGFITKKETKEELLKAGPELQESINQIKTLIKERQKFYYG